jgi:hypothetical protein
MEAVMTIVVVCLTVLPAGVVDPPASLDRTREPGEAVRRLSAEFDSAQRAAFEEVRLAKTETERSAANRAIPDRRKYARQFLELARQAKDEATVVPALVWIVRNGFRTPESDEAVRQIGEHHIRSAWIAGACVLPLGNRGVDTILPSSHDASCPIDANSGTVP